MSTDSHETRLLASIATEHKREKVSRMIATLAWVLTFVSITMLGVIVAKASNAVSHAGLEGGAVYLTEAAFFVVLVFAALVMSTLSTVGVFLRMRAATLAEIQLRLASLERVFLSQDAGRE